MILRVDRYYRSITTDDEYTTTMWVIDTDTGEVTVNSNRQMEGFVPGLFIAMVNDRNVAPDTFDVLLNLLTEGAWNRKRIVDMISGDTPTSAVTH